MEFSPPRDLPGRPRLPTHHRRSRLPLTTSASSRGGTGEAPRYLQRLAEVPDPRDPRGVRHALAVVLAPTACAVLAGATSLLAVGEWIADTPPHLLELVGVRPDPTLTRGSRDLRHGAWIDRSGE
jgi:hypothetical protein